MMATTYQYLLRRKAELETGMIEAQRRAQAPFESELARSCWRWTR